MSQKSPTKHTHKWLSQVRRQDWSSERNPLRNPDFTLSTRQSHPHLREEQENGDRPLLTCRGPAAVQGQGRRAETNPDGTQISSSATGAVLILLKPFEAYGEMNHESNSKQKKLSSVTDQTDLDCHTSCLTNKGHAHP